jgi:hypothetical protein
MLKQVQHDGIILRYTLTLALPSPVEGEEIKKKGERVGLSRVLCYRSYACGCSPAANSVMSGRKNEIAAVTESVPSQ